MKMNCKTVMLIFAAFLASGHAMAKEVAEAGRTTYEEGLKAYETDPGAACSLFVKAVSEGSVEAMMAAGHCCAEGRGVPENYAFAMTWRMNAVKMDPVRACKGMAMMDSLEQGLREKDLPARRDRFEQHAPDVEAALAYVNQLLNDGQQTEAEDMLERAIVKFHPDARLLFIRGVMCRSRWDKSSAEIYFKGVAALEPDSYRASAGAATINLDRQQIPSSVDASMKKLVKDYPDDIFLHWLYGIHCRTCWSTYPEGVQTYEWILERWNPGPVMVHQTYANELSERWGRDEEALKHREIALKQSERSWTCQGMANTLYKLYRFPEAERFYARAVELDEHDFKYIYQWGRCLARLERFIEAEALFREALEIDPSDVLLRYDLAKCLVERGQSAEAFRIYTELEARGRDADEMLGLATLYRHGIGVEKDEKKADEYMTRFHKSIMPKDRPMIIPRPSGHITHGAAMSPAISGEEYYYGRGRKDVEYAAAADGFMKAVKKGADIGACGLVQVYAIGGYGLERNTAVALEWFDWLENKNPKNYLRSPAVSDVVRIRMGCYGKDYANPAEAVRIARAVYELDATSDNGLQLARALAFDNQFSAAAGLMDELVKRAEKNGHVRGLEEKKRLLALYTADRTEEIERAEEQTWKSPTGAAPYRPADLNASAAEKDESPARKESAYILQGHDYASGRGVDKDLSKAMECYIKAFEMNGENKGHAARLIGGLYRVGGPNLEKNVAKAEGWFQCALDAGDKQARTSFLLLYLSPDNPESRNMEKAVACADALSVMESANVVDLHLCAQAYAQVGRFDDAIKLCERVIKLFEQQTHGNTERVLLHQREVIERYKRGEKPFLTQ